jgi:DHA1 family tetracycline resistance protein-like MFS transporter
VTSNNARQSLLTPLMRWFLFAMILANIAGSMFPVLMPIYLTELGASVTQVGLVYTLSSVAILGLQILGGWISDNIGRLRAIAIGSIGGVFGYIAMLLAPSWQWMLVAITINQIPYALVGPSFGAFIAENSTEANRGRVYGLTDTIYQITGVVGPPLGGLLAGRFGFQVMLLASALLYSFAAVLRIWMARTMKSPAEAEPRQLSLGSLTASVRGMLALLFSGTVITWIFLTDGAGDIAFRLSSELQPLYVEQIGGLTLPQIGLLGSFFSMAMMATPILSGRLIDRFGERVPISGGFLLIFASFMLFVQVSGFGGFALSMVILGMGVGLSSPAYQSLISKVVPQTSLGIFTGIFRSSLGLISLPAPWIGALLWERFNPQLPFIITGFVALLSIVPVWFMFKIPEKKELERIAVLASGVRTHDATAADNLPVDESATQPKPDP